VGISFREALRLNLTSPVANDVKLGYIIRELQEKIEALEENPPAQEPLYLITGGEGYSKTGTWQSSSLKSYNDSPTEYANVGDSVAVWTTYAPRNGNYDIFVWYPESTSSNKTANYDIITPLGTWKVVIDQTVNGGKWSRLATIRGQKGAGITVRLTSKAGTSTRTGAVQISFTRNEADEPSPTAPQDTTSVLVFANQSGYDLDKPKRVTVTNVSDGTAFAVKRADDNTTVYTGTVTGQVADFTSYNPAGAATTQYYVECNAVKSDNFKINKYLMARVSTVPALRFMVESRSDTWKPGLNGLGWRDSHQFSFELPSLVWQYMANPSVYDRMPHGVTHLSDSKFAALRTQNEPDIVWLIKFGAMVYYDLVVNKGKQLHALVKAQLAYFLYLYPHINQWVDETLYTQIRDMTVTQWSVAGVSSDLQWYDVGSSTDNNLLATQSVIGDIKGSQPPGYAILPNLLMYEVAVRDGLANPQQYMTAAVNNAKWLVDNVDLSNPSYTKGQRMSEHVTLTALAYMLEKYPAQAPSGTQAKIDAWAAKMIARSNNLWDLRKYSDTAAGDSLSQWTVGESTNEPGNIAGFPSVALAARRVIGNSAYKSRLMELAVSHIDHMFGRNPFGRHFSHDAATEIEGVKRGWAVEYPGVGAGDLGSVPAVIDGSPKESAYPFAPTADPGYVEGWVAHNTAWNMSLAYSAADDVEVKVYDSSFTSEVMTVNSGDTIGIQLKAPLNLDPSAVEMGVVKVTLSSGTVVDVTVTEVTADDFYFRGTYVVPANTTYVNVSYGYGLFKKETRVSIGGEPPQQDTEPPSVPTNLTSGTPTTDSVPLSWTASTDNVGVTGYRIEGGASTVDIGNVTSYTLTGLSPSTTYAFTVKAKDSAGNVSSASNAVTITTAAEVEPTQVAYDTFTRDNGPLGVSESGQTWDVTASSQGSAWTVVDGKAAYTATNLGLALIDVGTPNAKVSAKITYRATDGLAGRVKDFSNHYIVRISSAGFGMFRIVSGASTSIGNYAFTPTAGREYQVAMEFDGTTIKGYLDGELKITALNETAYATETKFGLRASNSVNGRYDDFVIEA